MLQPLHLWFWNRDVAPFPGLACECQLDLRGKLPETLIALRFWSRFLRFLRRLPIRVWLLFGYLALFLAVIIPMAIGMSLRMQVLLTKNIETQLEIATTNMVNMVRVATTVSIQQHLRAIAEKNVEIVRLYYEDYRAGRLTEGEAKQQAARVLLSQRIGKTGYLYVLDSRGRLQVHPSPELLDRDLRSFEFIRKQIVQKSGFLEYEWKNPHETAPRPKALYMSYFAPWDWIVSASSYREEFSELIHVDDFRREILSNHFGETGYTYVMDSRGNLIIHPVLSGNIYDAADSSGRHFTRKICREKNGKTIYSWRNPGEEKEREKLAIYRYIPELDWIVVSTGYLEEVYAPLHSLQKVLYVGVLAMFLLLVTLSFWISRAITKPLQDITQAFAQGAAGRFSTRVRTRAGGEIRLLASYFNKFMRELDQYSRSLREEMRQRKRAQRETERTSLRHHMILENANEGFMEVGPDRVIVDINPETAHLLGRPPEEIIGHKIYEFVDSPSAERIREHMELRKIGLRSSYEVTLLRPDGSHVVCLVNGAPIIDEGGNRVSSFALLTDITQRKMQEEEIRQINAELERRVEERTEALQHTLQMMQQAQEQLVQSEKMAALGQLVAGVAHEINTPVGVGMTAATHLQESVRAFREAYASGRITRSEMERFLQVAEESASILAANLSRAADLIGSFKQIAVDRASGDERTFALAEYIQELLLSLKPRFKHTNHRVVVDCPAEITMYGSPGAFSQILTNLVLNSLTHGFEGRDAGTVTIRVRRQEDSIELECSDDGVGIPPENLNRIFDPFFTTKRGRGGSGLGLHIVYNLVTRTFGGRIRVQSVLGGGVTFTLTFPAGGRRDVG